MNHRRDRATKRPPQYCAEMLLHTDPNIPRTQWFQDDDKERKQRIEWEICERQNKGLQLIYEHNMYNDIDEKLYYSEYLEIFCFVCAAHMGYWLEIMYRELCVRLETIHTSLGMYSEWVHMDLSDPLDRDEFQTKSHRHNISFHCAQAIHSSRIIQMQKWAQCGLLHWCKHNTFTSP